ncbi:MAG: class I SAM-dependent methyltransferase [Hydrogenovibrio sp.]|uniref:class I SAM-dependent methyltransferase n=1 Tax=Hydrogenovibrio sp. TaxID=2065821 RepID=UPI0028702A64|nr:class I SAM-dependent methyltransferase [Hydrogenovibrio sp.]MDR9498051.1 class I SAM-dependent methyltransferase [Hydrogenovibrio sp.]
MKIPESDMPETELWASFFDPETLLETLVQDAPVAGDALELGAGYGTFTPAIHHSVTGQVHAWEIESALCTQLRTLKHTSDLSRLRVHCGDFLEQGFGLPRASQSLVVVFNLLHLPHPVLLLAEAFRVLAPGGRLLMLHWRSDQPTPRGPSLDIRPKPQECKHWAHRAGFAQIEQPDISASCPHHFALIAHKH